MLTAFTKISILVSATHPPFYQMKLYTVAVYDLRKCTNLYTLDEYSLVSSLNYFKGENKGWGTRPYPFCDLI